ncbi:MAG: plasmid stabilization protein [Burkholderiales bacterium]|nr:plasmid stabilization protein [Burkholderiales bacterium]
MATVTVRNLPDAVHRALRVRAAMHGRSTEAEIRDILESTVCPPQRLRIGTALAELGSRIGLTDDDMAAIAKGRARRPARPLRLG